MYYRIKNVINVIDTTIDNKITFYYQHFFERYRLRMGLNIPNMLDVIKMFYRRNETCFYTFLPQPDGSTKTFGIVKDGFAYGKLDLVDHWCLNKTFISNKTANSLSTNAAKNFKADLQLCMRDIDKVKNPEIYKFLQEFYQSFVPKDER